MMLWHEIRLWLAGTILIVCVGTAHAHGNEPAVLNISRFAATAEIANLKIPARAPDDEDHNFSGVVYCPETGTLFVIDNEPNAGDTPESPSQGDLYEFALDGTLRRHVALEGFVDPEAIAYLGVDPRTPGNVRFVIAEERIGVLDVVSIEARGGGGTVKKSELPRGATIVLDPNPTRDGNEDANDGIEGVAYDVKNNVFFVAKERGPKRGVYRVQWSGKTEKVAIPGLFSGIDKRSEPLTDLADLHYAGGTLLVLGQETKHVVQVSIAGLKGEIVGQFPPLGKKLPHKQAEGITLDPSNRELWIIGEPREMARYGVAVHGPRPPEP